MANHITIAERDFDTAVRQVLAEIRMFALISGRSNLAGKDFEALVTILTGMVRDKLFEEDKHGRVHDGDPEGAGPADLAAGVQR